MQMIINVFFPSDLDLLKLMSLNVERLNYILCCNFHIWQWENRPSHLTSYTSILEWAKNLIAFSYMILKLYSVLCHNPKPVIPWAEERKRKVEEAGPS